MSFTRDEPAEGPARRGPADGTSRTDPSIGAMPWLRFVLPVVIGILAIVAWDLVVRINKIPHYVLPGPARSASSGRVTHLANRWMQRGSNRQPGGSASIDGGAPGMTASRRTRPRSTRGIDPSSPHV